MDQDFHFHGTYYAARTGGFNVEEASLIARAANFIDFFTETGYAAYWQLVRNTAKSATYDVVARMDNPRYTFQGGIFGSGVSPEDGLWCSYHFTPGNYPPPAGTPTREAVHGTDVAGALPPFITRDTNGGAAILQKYNPESLHDLAFGKLLNRPQSALSRQLILDAIQCATNDNRLAQILGYAKGGAEILSRNRADALRRFRLILLGVRAHVIADTWAHQDFCGVSNVMNTYWDVNYDPNSWNPANWGYGRQSIDYDDGTTRGYANHVLSVSEKLTNPNFEAVPNGTSYLGHGWMGHLPDFSFVKFRYKPCWASPTQAVERNNPEEYKSAWIELVSLFTQAGGRGQLKLTPVFRAALDKAIAAIRTPHALAGGGTGRKSSATAWQSIFGDLPVNSIDADAEPDPKAVLDGMVQATDHADRYGIDYVNVYSDLYLFQIAADYHFHFVRHYLQHYGIYRYLGSWSQQESALSFDVERMFEAGQWTALAKSALAGSGAGSGGAVFDDVVARPADIQPISKIAIRSGDIVDRLAVWYGSTSTGRGGTGGGETVLMLDPGDTIVEVSGVTGMYGGLPTVLQLSIKTRAGKSCTCGSMAGGSSQQPFSFKAQGNQAVVGFFGSVADHGNGFSSLGSLGVGWATPG